MFGAEIALFALVDYFKGAGRVPIDTPIFPMAFDTIDGSCCSSMALVLLEGPFQGSGARILHAVPPFGL